MTVQAFLAFGFRVAPVDIVQEQDMESLQTRLRPHGCDLLTYLSAAGVRSFFLVVTSSRVDVQPVRERAEMGFSLPAKAMTSDTTKLAEMNVILAAGAREIQVTLCASHYMIGLCSPEG